MSMNVLMFATSWLTQEHRVWGLDWSYLTILGLVGNAIFSTRFLAQWIASERRGQSVMPKSFWYWSIAGSVIMCVYWMLERSPVGILAYFPNTFIYLRNLQLMRRRNRGPSSPELTKTSSDNLVKT